MASKILTIGLTSLRRTVRDRTSLFLLLVLPLLVILLVGFLFGEDQRSFRFGVVNEGSGPLAGTLVAGLRDAALLDLRTYDDVDALRKDVRRGRVVAGALVPGDYDDAVRAGRAVEVKLVSEAARPETVAVRTAVSAVVDAEAARLGAARFTAAEAGLSFDAALPLATGAQKEVRGAGVTTVAVGKSAATGTPSRFASAAATQLVLFVFLSSLSGASFLVESRRLGVTRRAFSTPTSSTTILLGESFGRFVLALVQAAIVIVVGLLFGVSWGDPLGAAAVVALFVLTGTGAGMLLGTLARNGEQATAIGVPVAIAMGMLGGCMFPLDIVPAVLRTIGHALPHAWAVDAWDALLIDGVGIGGIATELAVLAAFSVGLLLVAALRLRRVIVQPIA